MNDFTDLEEVDDDDVKLRLFSQSLARDVRKWYKRLEVCSIANLQQFHKAFLSRSEVKKNPLQILAKYESLRRALGELVQDYSNRFNNTYNSILVEINPPSGLALLRYLDGFDDDISYQLRERSPTTLEDMKKIAINVEAKLLAGKAKLKPNKRVTIKEENSASSDAKLDTLVKTMENMMEKITLTDRVAARESQGGPQIINHKSDLLSSTIMQKKKNKQHKRNKRIKLILLVRNK